MICKKLRNNHNKGAEQSKQQPMTGKTRRAQNSTKRPSRNMQILVYDKKPDQIAMPIENRKDGWHRNPSNSTSSGHREKHGKSLSTTRQETGRKSKQCLSKSGKKRVVAATHHLHFIAGDELSPGVRPPALSPRPPAAATLLLCHRHRHRRGEGTRRQFACRAGGARSPRRSPLARGTTKIGRSRECLARQANTPHPKPEEKHARSEGRLSQQPNSRRDPRASD